MIFSDKVTNDIRFKWIFIDNDDDVFVFASLNLENGHIQNH